MTAPARPTCEWFLGCRRKAVALVAHPRKPVPTCQECIDRMGLRDRIVASLLEPAPGQLAIVPTPRPTHAVEHWFKGVCICPCPVCTRPAGMDGVTCTCPDCPPAACGLKAKAGAA